MKKLLSTTLVAIMLSSSAMAATMTNATITTIKMRSDGGVRVVVTPEGGGTDVLLNLDGIAIEAQKNIIASLLTAKSSGATATIRHTSGTITEVGY